MEMRLEPAKRENLEEYAAILREGRAFQQAQGFTQWTEDYPNRDTVLKDLRLGRGYALLADGRAAGYLCLDFGGEPAYAEIDGAWGTEEPYGVVHRMAFGADFQGKGLADAAFRRIEELCVSRGVRSLRVDTGFQNQRMQHILAKNGFSSCGVIFYQGSPRLAYDKAL